MKKLQPYIKKHTPWIAALAMMGLVGVADAGTISTALNPAAKNICAALQDLVNSPLVAIAALAMFIGGAAMMWFKVRGGLAVLAGGIIGFFIVKQLVAIAKGFGILDASVACV